MLSDLPVPNELLRLLLAQQQDQERQQHSAATPVAPAPSYYQRPMGLDPLAPATPSLSQLMEYLHADGNPWATHPPAPVASKPQENYDQLQRYLNEASSAMQASNVAAAITTAHQSLVLPQRSGTTSVPAQSALPSYQPTATPQHAQYGSQQQRQSHQAQQQQFQPQDQQPLNQQLQQQNLTSQQMQDNILASLRLLAEIDPRMAAEAVKQVLNVSTPTVQGQNQFHHGSNAQAHQQPQPHIQGSSGHNQQPKALTPSPSLLNQKQLSSLSQPRCATTEMCGKSSAAPPVHDDGNLNNGIFDPPANNGNRVRRREQVVGDLPATHMRNDPLTNSCGIRSFASGSKSLEKGVHVVTGKTEDKDCQGKAKSQEKVSASKSSKQRSKKHHSPIHQSTKQSKDKKVALCAAAALGVQQKSMLDMNAVPLPPSIPTPDSTTLQGWSLDLLEMHVQQLKHASQPIPQHLTAILFHRRRKEEKCKSKRLANRKSATVSRAKKKALIEDMTKDNARLRKKVTILNCFPDLIISITKEGKITFCGSQVEKVLRHTRAELLGANIREIVIPDSMTTIQKLIQDLVETTKHQTCAYGETVTEGRAGMNGLRNDSGREAVARNNAPGSADCHALSDKPCQVSEFNTNTFQPFADEDVFELSVERGSKHCPNHSTTESNDSSERSASCYETLNAEKGKKREKLRRLVPVYNVCFIRNDLTTILCEMTSSILCSRSLFDGESSFDPKAAPTAMSLTQGPDDTNFLEDWEEDELLLCIRPVFEGNKAGEEIRFARTVYTETGSETPLSAGKPPSASCNPFGNHSSVEKSLNMPRLRQGSFPEKRQSEKQEKKIHASQSPPLKKNKAASMQSCTTGQDVQSIAESLMLMSHCAS